MKEISNTTTLHEVEVIQIQYDAQSITFICDNRQITQGGKKGLGRIVFFIDDFD